MPKQRKHIKKGDSPTSTAGASSALPGMSFWLEKINAGDVARLWSEMQGSAVAAKGRTTWGPWESGTISSLDCQAVVTACTTQDGFVLTFTAKDTCK